MAKPGPLDFILDGNELVFEVCSLECNGDFLVCYGSDPSGFQTVLDGCDTKCALGNKISFVKPFSTNFPGVVKSDLCFEVKMKNGAPSILSSEGEIANTTTCAPKVENGVMTLNNNYATSECSASSKNAIIKHETTTIPPPTTATLGQFGRLSFGENGHAFAAITDEPGSFFNDYWWIFLILALILVAVGIGIGVCCYLRRKKNAQPIPARRRKLQGSKSTVVSTEAQKCKTEN
uniref:Uncharacterized protein n=1 Tax=Panagrolaimus sp. PS1159 TaxID=55785 RepID=A0AC35F4I7_9BILA